MVECYFKQFKGFQEKQKADSHASASPKPIYPQQVITTGMWLEFAAVSADPFRSKTATRCFRDAASPTVNKSWNLQCFLKPSVWYDKSFQVLSGFPRKKTPFSFRNCHCQLLMEIPALPTTQIAPILSIRRCQTLKRPVSRSESYGAHPP